MSKSSQENWRKSSFCGANGCVEVAISSHGVGVRDSKDATSPVLQYTPREWLDFLKAVRAGEFDLDVEMSDA
jgi:hypothetical protein